MGAVLAHTAAVANRIGLPVAGGPPASPVRMVATLVRSLGYGAHYCPNKIIQTNLLL